MRIPKYRKNGDGRAFVEYRKQRTYLGVWGTPESERRYRRFIGDIMADAPAAEPVTSATISHLCERYLRFAERYYSTDGRPTQEFTNVENAIDDFAVLFGQRLAATIGPRDLRTLQSELVTAGYARTTINARLSRVKRCLRWCASEELLPRSIIDGLWAVDGLRKGRTDAIEPAPVEAVPIEHVIAILPHVSPPVAAMIQVQYLCGMRPQDVCGMRLCDIDRSSDVWIYRPESHKNRWRKKTLLKGIPPIAQKILAPFIKDDHTAFLFSPRMSVAWWATQRPRKSKVHRYELRQREAAKRRAAKRVLPARYTSASYGKAIAYGIARANRAGASVLGWSPNQLRHAIAGELSRTLGQQAAQRWLGHVRLETTALYDELHAAELTDIASRLPASVAQSRFHVG